MKTVVQIFFAFFITILIALLYQEVQDLKNTIELRDPLLRVQFNKPFTKEIV